MNRLANLTDIYNYEFLKLIAQTMLTFRIDYEQMSEIINKTYKSINSTPKNLEDKLKIITSYMQALDFLIYEKQAINIENNDDNYKDAYFFFRGFKYINDQIKKNKLDNDTEKEEKNKLILNKMYQRINDYDFFKAYGLLNKNSETEEDYEITEYEKKELLVNYKVKYALSNRFFKYNCHINYETISKYIDEVRQNDPIINAKIELLKDKYNKEQNKIIRSGRV